MPKVMINSSFQINLPQGVAQHIGVNPGDYIEFRVIEGGRVIIEKVSEGRTQAELPPRPATSTDVRTSHDFLVSVRAGPEGKKGGSWG